MSYTWANAEQTGLIYTDGDVTIGIPVNPANRHYVEYLASGETAAPYVEPPAPPELTTEEKINNLLSAYGLSREELQEALIAKTSAKPATKKK